jgi:tetratricopeptide (TPR) repeat protein
MTTSIFVERALHLDALLRIMQGVCNGQGHIVLLSGEAGIGKTRLLRELKVHLTGSITGLDLCAPFVLQGNCFEPDRSLAFGPLTDLLRRHFSAAKPEASSLKKLPGGQRSLTRLLPDLAADLLGAAQSATEMDRHDFLEDLRALFVGLSNTYPLAMIVEDLHWADEATLDFLAFLARHISDYRILLILSYRADEVGTALDGFLATLDRSRFATEFSLPRLTRSAVAILLRALLHSDQPIRTGFLEQIYTLTEGNPFFIEEVVKSIVVAHQGDAESEIAPDKLRVPRTVQVAVQQRVAQLSVPIRRLIQLAAVMGRQFDFTLLMRLTGEAEETLLQHLRTLVEAQLVVEASTDIFAFRHALTRQAVYSDLLLRERRLLHRTVADLMEQICIESAEHAAYLDDLAYHTFQGELWAKAIHYAEQAAERARSLYSPHSALAQYSRAFKAAEQLHLTPAPMLYRNRGQVYEQIGDFEAAQANYLQALQTARQQGEISTAWQSLLDLGFLWTGRDFLQAGRYFEQAVELANKMDNSLALASSLNRIGNWYANVEQPFEALRYHHQALTILQKLDNPRELAVTLDLLGVTNLLAGDMVSSVKYYHRAVELWRQLDERQGLSSTLATLSLSGASVMTETLYCPAKTLDQSLAEGGEALQLARSIGWQAGEAGAHMYTGLGLIARGEYARALEMGHQALEVATRIEHRLWIAGAHMLLGRLYLDILALPEAEVHLTQALGLARNINTQFMINANSAFLALLYLAQGKPDEACQLLDIAALSILSKDTRWSTTQRLVIVARAEAALAQGQAQAALGIVERLLRTASNLEDLAHAIPHLCHLQGQCFTQLQRWDEAQAVLEQGLQASIAQGVPPQRWRMLVSLGQLYLAIGKRTEAEQALHDARNEIKRIAETLPELSLSQAFLANTERLMPAVPSLTSRQAVKAMFGGLTERERQIVTLIAEGQSNREIADTLFLSKRTVDAHIGNILGKLGFSSRAQVVRWAVEKGLLGHQ